LWALGSLDLVALQIDLATVKSGATSASGVVKFLEVAATAAAQNIAGGITIMGIKGILVKYK